MDSENNYNGMERRTEERRKFLRVHANFITTYYVYPDELANKDMTLSRNISLGGICFTTDRFFEKGTILYIALRLPKIDRLIEILGEVVFVKKEEKKLSLYDIGAKFVRAEEEDLLILEQVIKKCASSDKQVYFEINERRKE